jgi:hypothetical protein
MGASERGKPPNALRAKGVEEEEEEEEEEEVDVTCLHAFHPIALSVLQVFSCVSAQCIAPLGMESGTIKDEDITASSSFDNGNVGPQFGR